MTAQRPEAGIRLTVPSDLRARTVQVSAHKSGVAEATPANQVDSLNATVKGVSADPSPVTVIEPDPTIAQAQSPTLEHPLQAI